MRYRSFNDFMDLKKTILDLVPSKIDIGAIYNTQVWFMSAGARKVNTGCT